MLGHIEEVLADLLTVAEPIECVMSPTRGKVPMHLAPACVPTCASPADVAGEPRHGCDGVHACYHHLQVGNTFEHL